MLYAAMQSSTRKIPWLKLSFSNTFQNGANTLTELPFSVEIFHTYTFKECISVEKLRLWLLIIFIDCKWHVIYNSVSEHFRNMDISIHEWYDSTWMFWGQWCFVTMDVLTWGQYCTCSQCQKIQELYMNRKVFRLRFLYKVFGYIVILL